jgi:hypothetical protein
MTTAWVLFVWVCASNARTDYVEKVAANGEPYVQAIPVCNIEHPPEATRFMYGEEDCRDAEATYAKMGARMPNLRWECVEEAE